MPPLHEPFWQAKPLRGLRLYCRIKKAPEGVRLLTVHA